MKGLSKHSQMNNEKKGKRIKRAFLLVYIALLLSIVLIGGLSKFKRIYTNENVMGIAKVITNIVYDTSPSIQNLHNEWVEWDFSVNNFNGEQATTTDISNVKVQYFLQVDLGTLTGLQYKLYQVSGQTKTELQMSNNISVLSFYLGNQLAEKHDYSISIKTSDNVNQKDLTGNIKISAIATQLIN